jgi:hypothetical protein
MTVSQGLFILQQRACRDYRGTSEMCHKPAALERAGTKTLSVGALQRDWESVEAKGMPEVK